MTNADGVLDQIDHALHDWDTSGDAMRWTPEPPPQRHPMDPEAIRQAMDVAIRVGTVYREAMARFTEKMAEMLPRMAELGRLIKEAQAAERQHNLHVAYRRRQKRRGRR